MEAKRAAEAVVDPIDAAIDIDPIDAAIDIDPIEAAIDIDPIEAANGIDPIEAANDIDPVDAAIDINPIADQIALDVPLVLVPAPIAAQARHRSTIPELRNISVMAREAFE